VDVLLSNKFSLSNLAFEIRFSNQSQTPPPGIRPGSQQRGHELVAYDPVYSPTILHNVLTIGQWLLVSNTDLCVSAWLVFHAQSTSHQIVAIDVSAAEVDQIDTFEISGRCATVGQPVIPVAFTQQVEL